MASSGDGTTIKYSLNEPTVPYTSETTQFHEECVRRGILTKEQTIVARGATLEQARRVLEQERLDELKAQTKQLSSKADDEQYRNSKANSEEDDDNKSNNEIDDDVDDEDDDEEYLNDPALDDALQSYRQTRLKQLQQRHKRRFGELIPISRADWTREVNDASKGGDDINHQSPCWVLILLTASPGELPKLGPLGVECARIELAFRALATKFTQVKFITIPFRAAIEHWPIDNLPTMFCYYDGKCRHQLIGLDAVAGGPGVTTERLEWTLAQLSTTTGSSQQHSEEKTLYIPPILETFMADEPPRSKQGVSSSEDANNDNNHSGHITLGTLGQVLQQQTLDDDD